MKRKVLAAVAVALLLLTGISLYAATARGALLRARALLTADLTDLNEERIEAAIDSLEDARSTLASAPVQILRAVPVARQNLSAVRGTVDDAIEALRMGIALKRESDRTLGAERIHAQAIDHELFERLAGPLQRQERALRALGRGLDERRSGWLLPPVWDALTGLEAEVAKAHSSVERAANAVRLAPQMLGRDGKRTYLTLFINNAESRGAGDILSSLGTVRANGDRLSLGRFSYYADFAAATPAGEITTPRDFDRRFARYRAATNLWINTTVSADVPDVARVAARLYESAEGTAVDGVILIDPRGLRALLMPGQRVQVPNTSARLLAEELPRFIYSDAYALFADNQPARRETLLGLGQEVLREFMRRGVDRAGLERMADAVQQGHIRVVSFHEDEADLLVSVGASGELTTDATDSLLVTLQNLGADKLDYWIDRSLEHRCAIGQTRTTCRTIVSLRNEAPRGLPEYVTQSRRPYGIYRGYLEIYIPGSATLSGYSLDGASVEVFSEPEDGRVSLGADVRIRRTRPTVVEVEYSIPVAVHRYSLEVTPQPLARDATLDVSLTVPQGWAFDRPVENRSLRYDGPLTAPFRAEARPRRGHERTGIPALWDAVVRFWNDPLL